jgi:regulation of enolase protein 1 (concanavalin A-like superfamily)
MVASSVLFLAIVATGQQGFDPAQLVGVWEMVKGPPGMPAGSTLTFKRDGEFESRIKGTSNVFTGKFRVDGASLMLDPPGFPATIQAIDANNIVIVGITGPGEYRRQGAGGGNRAAMPRAGQRSTSGGFNLGGGGFSVQSKNGGGMSGPGGNGAITAGPGTKDGGTVTPAAGGWKLVANKPYGFRVEMPRQPNGEEGGSGGGFDLHVLTCQLSNMELLIMGVKGPTEIPKGEEDKVFQRLLTQAAGKIGGTPKVLSEGEARAGSLEGRQYEITLEKSSAGSVPARARAFLSGKSAYVLIASARAKGQALPADAKRFLESFVLSTGGGESESGPAEPRPRGSLPGAKATTGARASSQAWGKEVDPDGDVEIRRKARSLTMSLPGTPHVLAPERGKMNAPRVVARAEGDFVATVRVVGAFRPGRGSTVKGLSSRQAGGLIVWKDAGNYLVFQHRATADDGDARDQAVLEELVAGGKGATLRQPVGDGPLFLRLERKKGRITAAFSGDRKSWTELKPLAATWAEGPLEVGVVAVSTSPGPHEVTFEDLTIEER